MISTNANRKPVNKNTCISLKKSYKIPKEQFKLSKSYKNDNIPVALPLQSNKCQSSVASDKDTQMKSFKFLHLDKRDNKIANTLLAREVRSNAILSNSNSPPKNCRNKTKNAQTFIVRNQNESNQSLLNSSFGQILDFPTSFPLQSNNYSTKEWLKSNQKQQVNCQKQQNKNYNELEFEDVIKQQSSFLSDSSFLIENGKISQNSLKQVKLNINDQHQGTKSQISSQFYDYLKDSKLDNIPQSRKRSNIIPLQAQRRQKQYSANSISSFYNETNTLAAQRCFSEYSKGKIENIILRQPSLGNKNTFDFQICNQRQVSPKKSAKIQQVFEGNGPNQFQRFGTSLSLNKNNKICLKLESLNNLSQTDLSLNLNSNYTTNSHNKNIIYSQPQNNSVNIDNSFELLSQPNNSNNEKRKQLNFRQRKIPDSTQSRNSQLSAYRMLQELINLKKDSGKDNQSITFQEKSNSNIIENYSKKNEEPPGNVIQSSSRKFLIRKTEPLKNLSDQLLPLSNSESLKEIQIESSICQIYKRSFFPPSKYLAAKKSQPSLPPQVIQQNLQPLVIVSSENVLKSMNILNEEQPLNKRDEAIKESQIDSDGSPKQNPQLLQQNEQKLKQNKCLKCLTPEEEKEDMSFQRLNSYFESKYKGKLIKNLPVLQDMQFQKESDCCPTQFLFDSFDPWEKIEHSSHFDCLEEMNRISDQKD